MPVVEQQPKPTSISRSEMLFMRDFLTAALIGVLAYIGFMYI